MQKTLNIRDVITVRLPKHTPSGREQESNTVRPALIVGLPDKVAQPRYPNKLIVIVPLRAINHSTIGQLIRPHFILNYPQEQQT